MSGSRKVTVTVSLETEQVKILDKITSKTNVPRSVLVRQGVKSVIKNYQRAASRRRKS